MKGQSSAGSAKSKISVTSFLLLLSLVGTNLYMSLSRSSASFTYGVDLSFMEEFRGFHRPQLSARYTKERGDSFDIPDLGGEVFAACVLLMDENMRLGEWIAYHFHVLPLRRLIVAVDPRSKTSPNQILEKWKPYVQISHMSDEMFLEEDWLGRARNLTDDDPKEEKYRVHRRRQTQFMKQCARTLKKENYTWTAFHDVDEFIGFDSHEINDTDVSQPGSLLRYVQHVQANDPNHTHMQKLCITIPRNLFGSVESTSEEIHRGVPDFIDPRQFSTLRYRHAAGHSAEKINGPVKSIADVSRIPDSFKGYSVHRAARHLCSTKFVWEHQLTIHHYVGAWELFSYRDDARGRSYDAWKRKARVAKAKNNDDLRPWIKGFVEFVGEDLARTLLEDVGPSTQNQTSNIMLTE